MLLPFGLFAQNIPERPQPPKLVNDFVNLIPDEAESRLEQKLVAYNDSTSTQIAVVIVANLGGTDAADYSFKLGEKWGVGQKGKNNGMVFLISMEERAAFIATGYGLEEKIPDAIAKRIIEKIVIPNFQQQKFYEGLDEATNEIMSRLSGTFKAEKKVQLGSKPIRGLVILLIIIFIIVMIKRGKGGGGGWGHTLGRAGSTIFWGSSGFGRGFGGGFGGSSGGGGFGGFGGGSFGGGGAGGNW